MSLQADQLRKKAEVQAASLAVDIDLDYCEDGEVALGLLRLAESLRTLPEHAKELRECIGPEHPGLGTAYFVRPLGR